MDWVVFPYSLSTKSGSTPRVALWRRLRRLGAISPTGSIYILPVSDTSVEAFLWLAQEIQQAQGEALVMRIQQFEGITDRQLIALFQQAHHEDYRKIDAQIAELEQRIFGSPVGAELASMQDSAAKLQRQLIELSRIDYFNSPEGATVAERLAKVEKAILPPVPVSPEVGTVTTAEYVNKQWVTRPRPM